MIDINNVFSVHEITLHIKNILESSVKFLQIEGEVSNLARPASGHIYFNLKDEKSLIKCVHLSRFGRVIDFIPKNGDKVVVFGNLTVYERDGQYQILVSQIIPYGSGLLHIKFEKLKEKLKSEGLFDIKHKKELPKYPQSIGIITSETGAVLHDIINIISRRYPIPLYLYPAIVQGNEAVQSLIAGIEYFCRVGNGMIEKMDVIIIGRGGGSFEDLFCFNDETLARAIFDCQIPIISAVGHETDFTICDFVADVRAATPSEAAELAVPDRREMLDSLQQKQKQLYSYIDLCLQSFRHEQFLKEKRLKERHPMNLVYKYKQNIDHYFFRLNNYASVYEKKINKFISNKTRFMKEHTYHAQSIKNNKQFQLKRAKEKMSYLTNNLLHIIKTDLQKKKIILNGISPKNLLQKGYSLVEKNGIIVKTTSQLKSTDKITIKMTDGKCQAEIT